MNVRITAGRVLTRISDEPINPINILIQEQLSVDRENIKDLQHVINDLELHYQIIKTPYGYIRTTDNLISAMQISCTRKYEPPHPEFGYTKYNLQDATRTVKTISIVEYLWFPNYDNSLLPEGSIALYNAHIWDARHAPELLIHEYAYKRTTDSEFQVCNNWYYQIGY